METWCLLLFLLENMSLSLLIDLNAKDNSAGAQNSLDFRHHNYKEMRKVRILHICLRLFSDVLVLLHLT